MRMAPTGALAPDPLSRRPYPPPAFPFAVGRIAGRFDEDCEGLVGHLRPHQSERLNRNALRRFVIIASFIAHNKGAARYVDNIGRTCQSCQ
jgi:hypothetical protein